MLLVDGKREGPDPRSEPSQSSRLAVGYSAESQTSRKLSDPVGFAT